MTAIPDDIRKAAKDAAQSFLGMAPCYPEQFQLQDAIARAILTVCEARTGWRDIASAPKDGTTILLYAPGWGSPKTGWTYGTDDWQDCPYSNTGKQDYQPTHWQPLPSAPSPPLRETEGEKEADAEAEKPIAHLVWLQGRRGPDDVEDYYEVARPGDKCVDGSDPFPVFARPSALLLEAEMALELVQQYDDLLRTFTGPVESITPAQNAQIDAAYDKMVAVSSSTLAKIRGRG